MASKHDVIQEIPRGHENRISSTEIAERVGDAATNVRDTMQDLREEGFPIGGGQGLGGYWIIETEDELQTVLKNIESNIETQEERKRLILEAFETPPVTYGEPEDAPEPDIPQTLRDAVDAVVDERGVHGAERYLQRRFRMQEDQDRALAGLSYLRTHFEYDRNHEVRAGP